MDRDFPPCLWEYNETGRRRKIRLIESNAKCGHLKKLTCEGTFRQVFIRQRPRTSPPCTLPLTHCISVYNILIHMEKRGMRGELNQPERRGVGQHFTKLGRKYQHDWLYLQSINSDKLLPQSPFTGQFFKMTTFCFGVNIVNYSMPVGIKIIHSRSSKQI